MDIQDLQTFETYRPLLASIAYRMLGSVAETDDILQDAFLKYQGVPRAEIISPRAFLVTIVTRLCLNRLESAQHTRETYLGPWLPEPLLDSDEHLDAAQRLELHESLSLAFLSLLEHLTPLERAVYLLRQVFDYEYAEIAGFTGKDEAACRQLFSRARKHVSDNRPRFHSDPQTQRRLLEQFTAAVSEGEMDGLLKLLADDVVMWADGGGKVRGAALQPLRGREEVARFVMASPRFAARPFETQITTVNAEPALILHAQGQTILVLSINTDDSLIREIRVVGNPDKLKGVKE